VKYIRESVAGYIIKETVFLIINDSVFLLGVCTCMTYNISSMFRFVSGFDVCFGLNILPMSFSLNYIFS